MKLQDVATIKTNFPEADFWLVRKGSKDKVGKPVRTFSEENIGIRITAEELLIPGYLFYVMMHLHHKGHWARISKGTLSLQHITVKDVKNLTLSP